MNGFERRREEKKSAILSAAFELFNQDGVDAVRMTDIAQKAHVSKVSVYNYFGRKEELARQVLYALMDKNLLEFIRIVNGDLSFQEKFKLLYKLKIETAGKLHESFLSHKILSSPKMQEFLSIYYETNTKPLFLKFIEQGKYEGDIDPDLSNEALLFYLESFKDTASLSLGKKQLIDLAKLIFFGLRGKSQGTVR